MSRPIHIHVSGIPVRIGRLWLIVVGVLVGITASSFAPVQASLGESVLWYSAAGLVVVACLLSLFGHELAHAWMVERVGGRINRIDPSMFGGLSDDSYPPDTPRSEASVAAAGPLASLAIGSGLGLIWLIARDVGDLVSIVIGFTALANLTLGVANLLPVFPLDGGRILRAFAWYLTDDLPAGTRVASIYGNFIALVGLITGGVLLSLGNPLSVWGAWMVLAFWAINREGRDGYAHTVWREASRGMSIEEAGMANSSRVQANRTIDDAIDDVLQGVTHGPLLVADEGRQIIGIVSLAQLRRIPRAEWPQRFVREVCSPLDGLPRASSDETILRLIERFEMTGADLILIVTRGRITGAVDLDATYERVRVKVAEERNERRRRRP